MVAEIIAYAIGAHHGIFDVFNEEHKDGFLHRENSQPEFDDKVMLSFFRECMDEEKNQFIIQKIGFRNRNKDEQPCLRDRRK